MSHHATSGGKRPDSAHTTPCSCVCAEGRPHGGQSRKGTAWVGGSKTLSYSLGFLGREAGWGEGRSEKAKKSQDVSSPPELFLRNPSNLQLVPAGQHGFRHGQLVRHGRPVDILHDPPHHVQLLCRRAKGRC